MSHDKADIVVFPCWPAVRKTNAVWHKPAEERAAIFVSLIHAVYSVNEAATRMLADDNCNPKLTPNSDIIVAPVAGVFARQ